jgi:outer membrane protein OmpA-like peptidoglycan-associated protein
MIFPKISTLVIAATLAAVPGIALAAGNTLVLVIGGEAYDGPPKFSVTYDGKPLGEGVVKSAIDTVTAGRFSDAANKTSYVQNFDFTIPEAEFKPNAEIAVKFTNEAFGGPGSSHDRNLYVQSVAVNGDVVPAAKLATRTKGGAAPNAMVDGYLLLKDGTTDAVAKAPKGGWPAAATAAVPAEPAPISEVAANAPPLRPAVEPAKIEIAQAETPKTDATEPAKPAEAAPTPKSAAPTPAPAPAAPVKPAPAPPAAQAAAPDAKAEGCTIDKSFAVVGFNENSNELTPKLNKQLDDVAKQIGAQRCAVRLTGYSSTEGSLASNALFSVERAQNALKYLRDKGIKFAKWQATGVGETKQFGASAAENRRVVIAVTPGP